MHTLRPQLRHWSTIAFIAILALALLPTVSRLLAHATGSSAWAEICTPQGVKAVTAAAAEAGKPLPTVGAHLDHCPLCGLAGSGIAPPPAARVAIAVAALRAQPRLFDAAPRPLHAWATPRQRGPPPVA